jgi:Fe-S protein assembly co-chaperone HscB
MAITQINFFDWLGIETSFSLDESDLRKRYLAAQRESHPDRFIGKSDKERTVAVQRSMDMTLAYETLKSPLLRAQHLLDIHGFKVNTEGHDTIKPSPELLMEMMELREQLAEADSEAMAAKAGRLCRKGLAAGGTTHHAPAILRQGAGGSAGKAISS